MLKQFGIWLVSSIKQVFILIFFNLFLGVFLGGVAIYAYLIFQIAEATFKFVIN